MWLDAQTRKEEEGDTSEPVVPLSLTFLLPCGDTAKRPLSVSQE